MKIRNLIPHIYQSILGILIEIAYSLAVIAAGAAIICLIFILKWSSGRI